MPDPSPAATLLFLREEELRQGLELLFFAQRDLASEADVILAAHGLGRPHHRVLHFVGRQPQITVSDLLTILHLPKQSLSRLTAQLVAQGLMVQRVGQRDRRQRHLALSETGRVLERQLWDLERARIAKAYREAGAQAVEGFRKVLLGLLDEPADRKRFERPATGMGGR